MKKFITAICLLMNLTSLAQDKISNVIDPDSVPIHTYLSEITVVGRGSNNEYQQLPEIVGTNIYAGKKNALIVLDNVRGMS